MHYWSKVVRYSVSILSMLVEILLLSRLDIFVNDIDEVVSVWSWLLMEEPKGVANLVDDDTNLKDARSREGSIYNILGGNK